MYRIFEIPQIVKSYILYVTHEKMTFFNLIFQICLQRRPNCLMYVALYHIIFLVPTWYITSLSQHTTGWSSEGPKFDSRHMERILKSIQADSGAHTALLSMGTEG